MGQEEMGWCRICEAVSGSQGETPATLPTAGRPRRDWLDADEAGPGLSVNTPGLASPSQRVCKGRVVKKRRLAPCHELIPDPVLIARQQPFRAEAP